MNHIFERAPIIPGSISDCETVVLKGHFKSKGLISSNILNNNINK